MQKEELLISQLRPNDASKLSELFSVIQTDPEAKYFHPHPFSHEHARLISLYSGKDMYLGAFVNGELIGYGMLRGWEAGYDIPSLGIYISPVYRGNGYAKTFMLKMHEKAAHKGASQVRLKVYSDNITAVRLYEKMGYVFKGEMKGELVGHVKLYSNRVES